MHLKEGGYCLKCSEGENASVQWLPTDDLANKSECNGTPPLKITSDNSCWRSLKLKFPLLLSRLCGAAHVLKLHVHGQLIIFLV